MNDVNVDEHDGDGKEDKEGDEDGQEREQMTCQSSRSGTESPSSSLHMWYQERDCVIMPQIEWWATSEYWALECSLQSATTSQRS